MRRGASPILSTILLMALALGMAASAWFFIGQQQDLLEGETQQPDLETVNLTCAPDEITWWIRNTEETAVGLPQADLFVSDADGLNESLSRQNIAVDAGFTRGHGNGSIVVAPGGAMRLGRTYSLELVFRDAEVSGSCRVGDGWWDAAWDHRRAIDLSSASPVTANVTLDAAALVDIGKLRSDCADLRGVNSGAAVPHEVERCDPAGNATVLVNLSSVEPGEAYVYYGNLQAAPADTTVVLETVRDAPLGPEEEVRLP